MGVPGPALPGHEEPMRSANLLPNANWLIAASADNTVQLWDAATGAPGPLLRGHGGYVWSAVFSPDRSRIVTASADGTARVWQIDASLEALIARAQHRAAQARPLSPQQECQYLLRTDIC